MIKPTIPLTPRAILILAGLIILGLLGNYFSLPLFFGVDFILGSIPVLIVVYFYGPGLGVLAALIASSYTYFLWGHPYAVIIFSLEALFVGFFLHQGRRSLLLLDGLYWLIMGMPAAWLFYGVVMHMDGLSTLLIMLKQGVNGIFNALLASLAITLPALPENPEAGTRPPDYLPPGDPVESAGGFDPGPGPVYHASQQSGGDAGDAGGNPRPDGAGRRRYLQSTGHMVSAKLRGRNGTGGPGCQVPPPAVAGLAARYGAYP